MPRRTGGSRFCISLKLSKFEVFFTERPFLERLVIYRGNSILRGNEITRTQRSRNFLDFTNLEFFFTGRGTQERRYFLKRKSLTLLAESSIIQIIPVVTQFAN